jgi:CCR4-NOT transcriptional regulation complex NOT5 subunit
MNVVTIDPKQKKDEERKQSMLDVLEEMRKQIEAGEITEFVACSMSEDGEAQIHASCLDLVGGVGLFEVGKHLLIESDRML